jgi:hypothetical protein
LCLTFADLAKDYLNWGIANSISLKMQGKLHSNVNAIIKDCRLCHQMQEELVFIAARNKPLFFNLLLDYPLKSLLTFSQGVEMGN